MKNAINPFSCLLAVLLVSVSACVKEPEPGDPHPPKPGWLLTKIVASETRGEPGGPVSTSITIDEFKYNKDAKPWLHTQYSGPDSNYLQLIRADTIFYDNKLRPVRRSMYTGPSTTGLQYRFLYTGDDQYPTTLEQYIIGAGGVATFLDARQYIYQDTIVYLVLPPHSDTITYVYNKQGNYIGALDPTMGQVYNYDAYDNNTNASRYLNLNFHWALNIPEADPAPLYSRNNWTHNGVDHLFRDITYDAEGKVSTSTIQYELPTRKVVSQYYYTKPD
jgi:hypothetical protein